MEKPKARVVEKKVSSPTPSLNMYRRIAVGFVVAVALMLGAVLYVSTVSATIHVTPVRQAMKTEFLLDAVKTPTKETEIRGQVAVTTVEKSQAFAPSGDGVKNVDEKAAGTVTIHNTSSRNQPLVATTRLLSPEGILFRLDDGVTVPAGGTVTAAVHADVAGASGNVAPTKFTIPGLSESLQALIYADSAEAFAGGVRQVAAISQQDIDRSALSLRGILEEEAKAALRSQVGDALPGESFSFEVLDQSSDVKAGTETSSFTLTMSISATGVFYDRQALQTAAVRKLYDQLSEGNDFSKIDGTAAQATVDKADVEAGSASLRVYLDGLSVPSSTNPSFDPGRFVGMSASEVQALLLKDGVATDATVEFVPFWLNRIPRLKDHISVVVEN
jgi:hypothetical protein